MTNKGRVPTEDVRKLPFTKEDMFLELRELILREAARIYFIRGPEAVVAFLGFEYEANESEEHYEREILARIQLEDFRLSSDFDVAYDYAFQCGKWLSFNEVTECQLRGVTMGMPQWGVEGTLSPYYAEGSKCRHVAEMATARYHLAHYSASPTVRELSLLANMSEATVRNSLSIENIKTEGKPARVDHETALRWLSGRRGFIPYKDEAPPDETLIEKTHRIFENVNFEAAIRHAAFESGHLDGKNSPDEVIAADAAVEREFVKELLAGEPQADIEKLSRVATTLGLHVPRFVAIAIQVFLENKLTSGNA